MTHTNPVRTMEIIAACLREVGLLAYPKPETPQTIEFISRSKKFYVRMFDCHIRVTTPALDNLPGLSVPLEDPECFEKIRAFVT